MGDGVHKTSLRKEPKDELGSNCLDFSAMNGTIVRIVEPSLSEGDSDGYVKVKLVQTACVEGWIKLKYLNDCPNDIGAVAGADADGHIRPVRYRELSPMDKDFSVINQKIKDSVCTHPACVKQFGGIEMMAKKIWVIEGQFIDEDSREAAETEVLSHGCKDASLDLITENGGLDVNFCRRGAFGKGLYFSTQACKAFGYAQNHLLLCQVALGREEQRHTVTEPDWNLSFEEVCEKLQKMSV